MTIKAMSAKNHGQRRRLAVRMSGYKNTLTIEKESMRYRASPMETILMQAAVMWAASAGIHVRKQ